MVCHWDGLADQLIHLKARCQRNHSIYYSYIRIYLKRCTHKNHKQIHTHRYIYTDIHTHTHRYIKRFADKKIKQTDRQTNRQIDIQKDERWHGRRLRGTGGRSPRKLRWGDCPCIRPPNILRSNFMRCEAKYELTKKLGVKEEYFCLKLRFLVKKKGVIIICCRSDFRQKSLKGRQKFLAVKWKFFS